MCKSWIMRNIFWWCDFFSQSNTEVASNSWFVMCDCYYVSYFEFLMVFFPFLFWFWIFVSIHNVNMIIITFWYDFTEICQMTKIRFPLPMFVYISWFSHIKNALREMPKASWIDFPTEAAASWAHALHFLADYNVITFVPFLLFEFLLLSWLFERL